MRKKVLYVITKGNWGGAQRYVFDLATGLPPASYDVGVAFGQPGHLAHALTEAGIATHHLYALERDVSPFADLKSLRQLYALFKKERPDIVHLNSSKAGGIGALAARLAGVPRIIFTAHGWPFWEQRSTPVRALIWLFSWLTAFLSHKVICVSNYDLAVARSMPFIEHKAVRIYNGIAALTLSSGEIIRKAFPSGVTITGTIGELTHNKNQIALIEEARKKPDMYVAIVGEGELRKMLEEKIRAYDLQDRVKLFGFMPATEVLRGFDVFVLPSKKEGLPYVLLEAKQAGLPIVANRIGGVGEILDNTDPDTFSLRRMIEQTTALYER